MTAISRWIFRQVGYLLGILAVLCSAVLGELVSQFAGYFQIPAIPEIADWPAVLRILLALIASGFLFLALQKLLRLQATWEFGTLAWICRSLKGVVISVIAIGLAAFVAQLLGSMLIDDAVIPMHWILLGALVITFLGIMPAIMFIKGLDQTGVGQPVEVFSREDPLPAAKQPDILIMAMSRGGGHDEALVKGQGYDAILGEIEARHGEAPIDHPITAFLEAAKGAEQCEALTGHRWFQTARSLAHHFHAQSPREARDRRILIIVSKPTKAGAKDVELNGGDIVLESGETETRIGFREFVERLMHLRFGESDEPVKIDSEPVDSFNYSEIAPGPPVDIFNYSEVEARVRELINDNIRADRFRRIRDISVDLTGGPKTYSLAAGAATLDAPATVSYVSTQRPYNLIYRVLQPRR